MNIGIIIFIISVIVTGISALRDKVMSKSRQNQKPPQNTQGDNQPKRWFL